MEEEKSAYAEGKERSQKAPRGRKQGNFVLLGD